jgi:hypothetical protein
MRRMTGPDVQAEQGLSGDTAAAWTLDISSAASGDAETAVLKLGERATVRSDWETIESSGTATIMGAQVSVLLDTVALDASEYLWEVSLLNSNEELVQRWRGLLYVSTALS